MLTNLHSCLNLSNYSTLYSFICNICRVFLSIKSLTPGEQYQIIVQPINEISGEKLKAFEINTQTRLYYFLIENCITDIKIIYNATWLLYHFFLNEAGVKDKSNLNNIHFFLDHYLF